MVVLLDPTEDPDDILRANRSRERRYMFDHAFDDTADQVCLIPSCFVPMVNKPSHDTKTLRNSASCFDISSTNKCHAAAYRSVCFY